MMLCRNETEYGGRRGYIFIAPERMKAGEYLFRLQVAGEKGIVGGRGGGGKAEDKEDKEDKEDGGSSNGGMGCGMTWTLYLDRVSVK